MMKPSRSRSKGRLAVSGSSLRVDKARMAAKPPTLEPTLDETNERQFRGCVEDWVIDQVTTDHSLVAEMVREGSLSPEEAAVHPQRNIVTRVLGVNLEVPVDVFAVDPYPGDRYVDIVGVDAYDTSATGRLPPPSLRRWHLVADQPLGLLAVARFATAHHKALSIPEWGTSTTGGDDGRYVREMARVVLDHDVAYQSWFDSGTTGILTLSRDAPRSLAAYTTAFGPTSNVSHARTSAGTAWASARATSAMPEWPATTGSGAGVHTRRNSSSDARQVSAPITAGR